MLSQKSHFEFNKFYVNPISPCEFSAHFRKLLHEILDESDVLLLCAIKVNNLWSFAIMRYSWACHVVATNGTTCPFDSGHCNTFDDRVTLEESYLPLAEIYWIAVISMACQCTRTGVPVMTTTMTGPISNK